MKKNIFVLSFAFGAVLLIGTPHLFATSNNSSEMNFANNESISNLSKEDVINSLDSYMDSYMEEKANEISNDDMINNNGDDTSAHCCD